MPRTAARLLEAWRDAERRGAPQDEIEAARSAYHEAMAELEERLAKDAGDVAPLRQAIEELVGRELQTLD